MRRLILLRHGQAQRAAEGGADFDRALTETGREDARRMGHWLAERVGRIDLALVSPAARARETWEAAGAAFPDAAVQHPGSFYAADPVDMLRAATAEEADTVVIVAHNPGLHVLALQIAQAKTTPTRARAALSRELPPAAAVVCERDADGALCVVDVQSPVGLGSPAEAAR